MNACLLVLALAAGCIDASGVERTAGSTSTSTAPPTVVDRWVAEDKLQHFALSFAATQTAYGGLSIVADHDAAFTGAALTGLALGLAKEIQDARIGRPFSFKDLAWDAAGVALAALLIQRIE